ncbi:MAG: hypothetical protein KC503_15500 [Myxococcales bacterium]|nr:hypothetical protein [Myxococcales bacterium]
MGPIIIVGGVLGYGVALAGWALGLFSARVIPIAIVIGVAMGTVSWWSLRRARRRGDGDDELHSSSGGRKGRWRKARV